MHLISYTTVIGGYYYYYFKKSGGLTWAKRLPDDRKVVGNGSNVAQRVLVEIDDILEKSLDIIGTVIILEPGIRTELSKDSFKSKHLSMERSELSGGLLIKIRVVVLNRRRLSSE